MHRLAPALLGAVLVLAAGPAFAQATAEGAAALQKGLTGILTPTLATAGLGEPIFEGSWTVEPAGAEYRVTGPALALALRDDADGRKRVVRIRCDGDRYTATAGNGQAYRLKGETPLRCEIRPGGGEPPVTITSRTRHAELTVDLAASLLTASTDESEGVTVTEGDKTQLAVHRLSLTSATTPRPGSTHQDIALQLEAEGLSAGDPAAGDGVTLGRLRYAGRLEDVDAAALRDRTWRVIAFALDAARRDPQAPPPPNVERKLDVLMRQVLELVGSASQTQLELTDLQGGGDDTTVGFESLTVGGGYRGLDRAAPGRGLGGDVALELRGLKVADAPTKAKPGSLSIDRVGLSGALTPTAGGPTAGAALTLDVDKVSFTLTEEPPPGGTPSEARFDLGKARYALSAQGLDVAGLIAVIGGFESLLAKHGDDAPPAEDLSPVLARVRTTVAALSQYGAEIGLSDLRLRTPDVNLAIGAVGYGETYAGLDGDQAGYGLRLALDDLTLDPGLPFGDWVPRQARIDIALKDIPSRSVQALFWEGVEAAIQADQRHDGDPALPDGDQAFDEAMQRIVDRLLQSDARLSIDSFRITAPKGAIDLGGGGTVDPRAAFGVTARAKLQVAGLDDFVKFLQTQPDGADAAAGITIFQMLGHEAKTAEGRPARDYDLVVDPAGRMLVNGTDLAAVMPK
ncbi:YdgA family protein [Inquilinus sp. Marseille-Q2685]|uniref:YdgA family protein n=1 Tax=Inquilinus sp. Marseille-Q2685 TaxID=2866581 RepID=UPI001CE463AB|nr:YdgA family protein [Inquilinus sp. Marseille-Q2685]